MTSPLAAIACLLLSRSLPGSAAFRPQPPATARGGLTALAPSRVSPAAVLPARPGGRADRAPLPPATALRSTAPGGPDELDADALTKYAISAATQMTLFAGAFKLLDVGIASAGIDPASIPFPAVALLFYAIALRSRVFNPLNNDRPNLEGRDAKSFRDRVTPGWAPPGVFFPIMWLLIIGPIRAYTSALVFEETGTLCNAAHLSLILHLTIGDIWNTINNTEGRYGASVVGVTGVVASVFFAAYQYYEVVPLAGRLLGATALWLCTASLLVADTWRLNPRPDGSRDPLYPVVGETKTDFAWFSSSE